MLSTLSRADVTFDSNGDTHMSSVHNTHSHNISFGNESTKAHIPCSCADNIRTLLVMLMEQCVNVVFIPSHHALATLETIPL